MIRPKLITALGDPGIYIGEQEYTSPGTYYFEVPQAVRRIHAVCVGAGAQGATDGDPAGGDLDGGGGAGGLGWRNNIEVEPGEVLVVQVGAVVGAFNASAEDGASWIKRAAEDAEAFDARRDPIDPDPDPDPDADPLVAGYAPAGSNYNSFMPGGTFLGDGGGNGGSGSYASTYNTPTGMTLWTRGSGGGAGGYTGPGGNGCTEYGNPGGDGGGGSGGAGHVSPSSGSKRGRRGGGVGIRGKGASGASVRPELEGGLGYTEASAKVGLPGSGGEEELYGAGGAGDRNGWNSSANEKAGHGAVRIIWGNRFSYPDNADVEVE